MPEVTVIIPAYNAASTIIRALDSVFSQTFHDHEVIVVDDGSTDATADAVARYEAPVLCISQPNGGPGRARNTAVARAGGRLVAFLDADDVWLPEKLERQVAYFARFPWTALLHTAVLVGARPADVVRQVSATPGPPLNVFCDLFHGRVDINTLTVMARRDVLQMAGGFDERRETHVEDWDLWLRVAARHPVGYLPWPLAVHHHGGVMSSNVEKTLAGQRIVIERARGICPQACAAHAANADRCMTSRLYDLHWELGYHRLHRGERRAAWRAFLSALRLRPLSLSSAAYAAVCLLPPSLVRLVHAIRQPAPESDAARMRGHVRPRPPRVPLVRDAIFHNTWYRRTRRAVVSGLHGADDRMHRIGRPTRRILFEAASPISFVVFRPVYEALRHDPRLEFWFTASGTAWSAESIFSRFGLTDRVIPTSKAAWLKVDALVNADFYEMGWLHRRARRLHLFHGVAGKYQMEAPVEAALDIATFDRILFPNADRLRRYVDAGLVSLDSAVPVLAGYPKVDCLVDGSLDRRAIAAQLQLEPGAPTALYAPTWSSDSSLNRVGENVIADLAAAGFNVVVKLHDRSYELTMRGSGGVDWTARLGRFDNHPRVRIVTDPDAAPCLFVSDILVTDHSSIGFEFTLLDRPIVAIDCPALIRNAHVNPDKVALFRAAAETVSDAGDILDAVQCHLRNPSRHQAARRLVARESFHDPGSATARAVSTIYEVLELDAIPAASRQHRPARLEISA
jgi:glycosyltransferase involved in cell wall biosynthesis